MRRLIGETEDGLRRIAGRGRHDWNHPPLPPTAVKRLEELARPKLGVRQPPA